MRAIVLAVISAAVAWLAAALIVSAHGAGEPWIIVPVDHVEQGATFTIMGADMSPGAEVTLELLSGDDVTTLGTVPAAADGHFMTDFVVPAEMPDGYVELRATDPGGSEAMTWLLVGDGTTAEVAAGAPTTTAAPWTDPSVILLGALLVGGAGALAYMLLRRRQPAAARITARRGAPRAVGPKSRKARRRQT
jgi:hypothetical protein